MISTIPSWLWPFLGGMFLGGTIIWAWSQQRLVGLKVEVAQLRQEKEATAEKLQWVSAAEASLREAFDSLAGKALQSNNEAFLREARGQITTLVTQLEGNLNTHRSDLTGLVTPLREHLTTLDGYVRDLEQKREGAYQGLQTQLQQLSLTHIDLQRTTTTLAEAFKNSGTRGRWGELQLRRLVEMAGMVKQVDFTEQKKVGIGNSRQPDMLVRMPNGGILPVDSKVPLTAYLAAVETCDEAVRQAKLQEHVAATRTQIRELSKKAYWDQFEQAPECVVMFVPNEASLSAVFELAPELLDEALNNRVLIATPVTLLALLKAVAYGWQQQHITDHAQDIVKQVKILHERLKVFAEHLDGLGKSINKSVESYNQAIGSLDHRVMPALRRFEELGLPSAQLKLPDVIEENARLPERGAS